MKYIVPLVTFTLLISSCRKDKVPHPFAGTYDCTVGHLSWSLNGGYSNTSEQKEIEILLDGDSVEVFGVKIHEDDIVYGESHFSGYSYNYMNFRFEKDSIYISTFSGGMGGGTTTSYRGRKLN